MGDENNGFALLCQRAHDDEQLVGLLRGQNGGGLVENQDVGLAVQQLDDFHALLHAHGQILNVAVRVHSQAVLVGNFADAGRGPLAVQETAVFCRFFTQHHIFGHRKHGHEHEMLVDHADSAGDGVAG